MSKSSNVSAFEIIVSMVKCNVFLNALSKTKAFSFAPKVFWLVQ
jgi:hypothetical protein